jgi:hypothetical protein
MTLGCTYITKPHTYTFVKSTFSLLLEKKMLLLILFHIECFQEAYGLVSVVCVCPLLGFQTSFTCNCPKDLYLNSLGLCCLHCPPCSHIQAATAVIPPGT